MKGFIVFIGFLAILAILVAHRVLPPRFVPSPVLEYMAEHQQRSINDIRGEMRSLQRQIDQIRHEAQQKADEAARRIGSQDGLIGLKVNVEDLSERVERLSGVSQEEQRAQERLRELSLELDEHRDMLLWCQQGLVR